MPQGRPKKKVEEDAERVTMLWPGGLKTRLRERVGQRGMTAFTIAAVEAALAASNGIDAADVQTVPAKKRSRPPKIEAEEPLMGRTIAPALPPTREGRRVEDVPLPGEPSDKYASSSTAVSEILRKASELGLKRASEIDPVQPHQADGVEPETTQQPATKAADAESQVEVGEATERCSNCGEPLVSGECWSCF